MCVLNFISLVYACSHILFILCTSRHVSFMIFYIYLRTRKRRIFMFFMFSFLISASCRWCNLKFACSYIADLLHCLREFSLVAALSVPLFSVSLAGGRAFIRLCGLITFALARESGIRGTTIWFYYETIIGMYSPVHGMQTCARFLSAAFRAPSFHRGLAREKFSLCNFARLAEVA